MRRSNQAGTPSAKQRATITELAFPANHEIVPAIVTASNAPPARLGPSGV